ncbi:MAG: TaqI-like C-terminal specificity domain-containing protein, partial [Crocinitomicaceae bacterium]
LGKKLGEVVNGGAKRGVLTGLTEAFVIKRELAEEWIASNSMYEHLMNPFLLGREIKPYLSKIPANYLIKIEKGFTKDNAVGDPQEWFKHKYPEIHKHLEQFQEKAEKRIDKGDFYWELRACDYYELFLEPKIMYQKFQVKPCFIYDEDGQYCNDSMWIIPTDDKALLGILNSKVGWWLISKYCTAIQNGYQLIWKYFSQIPIAQTSDKQSKDIANRVNQILKLKKENSEADITLLEQEIDELVYELYGLSEEEIKIVEGGVG